MQDENTKREVQVSLEVLPGLIQETIELEQELERKAALVSRSREQIKATMIKHNMPLVPTAAGGTALLIEQHTLSWNVDALKGALSSSEFSELCPRKPEGGKLSALLEGSEAERQAQLRYCFKRSLRKNLELRPPAKVAEQEK